MKEVNSERIEQAIEGYQRDIKRLEGLIANCQKSIISDKAVIADAQERIQSEILNAEKYLQEKLQAQAMVDVLRKVVSGELVA